MEIRAPTGTSTPTELAKDGTSRKRMTIKHTGTTATFQFLLIYTTPNPPNKAGKILSKAGFNTGEFKIGVSCASKKTPAAIITVVVMALVAIAMVEITSPSSVPGYTLAFSIAFSAAGTLWLVKLPVTKPR